MQHVCNILSVLLQRQRRANHIPRWHRRMDKEKAENYYRSGIKTKARFCFVFRSLNRNFALVFY